MYNAYCNIRCTLAQRKVLMILAKKKKKTTLNFQKNSLFGGNNVHFISWVSCSISWSSSLHINIHLLYSLASRMAFRSQRQEREDGYLFAELPQDSAPHHIHLSS